MEALVYKSEKGNAITTSVLVAEKFGKEHKNVMRDIREIMNKRSAQNWAQFYYSTTYMDSMNRKQEMIAMNRDGFSLLVMGFTGEEAMNFKLDFINAFNQMEQALKIQLPDFNNPVLAARAWADEREARQLSESKIKELAPKAQVYDAISDASGLKTVAEVSKVLGTGERRLFAWLRDQKILMSNNIPYQQYLTQGYFEVKSRPIANINQNFSQTYFTGRGEVWLAKVWKNTHVAQYN